MNSLGDVGPAPFDCCCCPPFVEAAIASKSEFMLAIVSNGCDVCCSCSAPKSCSLRLSLDMSRITRPLEVADDIKSE